jgi:hypothetical protein
MLLTDVCNRHSIRAPENRSTPEPAACAAVTTSAMRPEREPRAIRIAASDHLAAIRPQVEQRLTAPLQLRTGQPAYLHSFIEEERAPLESGASLPRRSRPRTGPVIRPLTPPVAPRVRPFKGVRRAPGPLPPPSRQRGRLPRSEAPSIDKCSLSRSRGGSPPPIPRLCRRGPASGALSLPDMLSHGGARPSTVVTGYSPVVARTARRLPISAIETNCEHNRSIDRAPHTALESPPAQLSLRVAEIPFRSSASRDFTGQGPAWLPMRSFFPPRSLAVEASPQPDWLGHLLSQACFRRRPEKPPPRMTGSPGEAPLSREPRREGPPHTPSREGERIPPHPRCLPSMGPPSKGCALAPPVLCFQSAVEQRAGAFSFTAHSPALTRPETAMTRERMEAASP